jgi:hypothetical protein
MRGRAGEKSRRPRLHKDVEERVVKGRVGRMAVRFPVLISEIEIDAAAENLSVIDSDRRVGKIRASLAIPCPELYDFDLLARRAGEHFPEIAREPARLQFQLSKSARLDEKRAFANFLRGAELRVTFGVGHL